MLDRMIIFLNGGLSWSIDNPVVALLWEARKLSSDLWFVYSLRRRF